MVSKNAFTFTNTIDAFDHLELTDYVQKQLESITDETMINRFGNGMCFNPVGFPAEISCLSVN